MTEDRMALVELLQKSGDSDFLRAVAEAVLQILMGTDVEGLIGAGRHERSAERLNYRNGYRERSLDTRLGSLQLRIPKLRQGSYFPPFLEPRKTAEKALVTVIQEAWIGGVSTRRVDELVQAMGLSGISKSQVSKLCKDIDERINAFAVDTLVHNFLHRTGILRDFGAAHPYGVRRYSPNGCAAIIERVAGQIDARRFNPAFPANFPRFVQHAIWRFCAEAGLNRCNGRRIDDRAPCVQGDCPLFTSCARVPLKPA